jgi:hypothetical protein
MVLLLKIGVVIMTVDEVIKTIKNLNRNKGSFYGFETLTEVGLNKTENGNRKVKRDFTLMVHRKFSAMVGISYENAVNNLRERNGEDRSFVAQKPFGMHHIEGENGSFILQGDRNLEQFYLAVDRIGGQTARYFINGVEVGDDEVKNIFARFGKPKKKTEEIYWRHYKVENILSIR